VTNRVSFNNGAVAIGAVAAEMVEQVLDEQTDLFVAPRQCPEKQ